MSFNPLRFVFTAHEVESERVVAFFEREMGGYVPDRNPAFWGDEVQWTLDLSMVCAAEPDQPMQMLAELMNALKEELSTPAGWASVGTDTD